MSAPAAASLPERLPRPAEGEVAAPVGSGWAWSGYLVVTTLLLPFVHPIGPGQVAVGDLLNLVAILAFGLLTLSRRPRLSLPFLIPALVIAGASLLATANCVSPDQSFVTLAQDAYLYLWFLMLVNVCAAQRDLRAVRVTWLWVSVAIALYGVFLLAHNYGYGLRELMSPKGVRAQATFGNANFFADYLVLSFFVIASLSSEVTWLVRLPALGAILLGLLASKSLGGMLSLLVGLGTWFAVRAVTRGASKLSLLAAALVVCGVGALGIWIVKEWDLGRQGLQVVTSQSVVGRLGKSSEGRLQIWGELGRRFEHSPLGIGPGNSSFIELEVANRERRGGSIYGKEAHNDYVGYAVERGPFALAALVAMIGLAFRRLATSESAIRSRRWRAGAAGAWTAALAAGLAASTVHSLTIEKLHFRHYWLFLGLLFALCAWMRRDDSEAAPPRRRASALSAPRGIAPARAS